MSKSHKDILIFCVSNISYKTQDTKRNITQEKHSVEQSDHTINMNEMTISRLRIQQDDC